MTARCLRTWRSCELALPEVERALSLLACGTGPADAVCMGAAKTAGARTSTKTVTMCFIAGLQRVIPQGEVLNHTCRGKCRSTETQFTTLVTGERVRFVRVRSHPIRSTIGQVGVSEPQPPNFAASSQRIASRWCAIISACQTSPTVMMLIATTQAAITKVFCVSEAGMWRQRAIQAMVRGLLVLGRYAIGPTRELPADAMPRRTTIRATKGPVRDP